jgi:hypothetical protein
MIRLYNVVCNIKGEKRKISSFEGRVLRRYLNVRGSERRDWKKLHNEELHDT